MFLSREELEQLTERIRPTAQIRWLKQHKFPFEVSAQGNPRVLKEVVLYRLNGAATTSINRLEGHLEPNYSAIS